MGDIFFNEDGSEGPVCSADVHRELLLAGKHGPLTERAMQLLEGTTVQPLSVRDIAPRRAEWMREGDAQWATRAFEYDGRMYCWVAEGQKRVPGLPVRPREVLKPKEDEETKSHTPPARTAGLYGPSRALQSSKPFRMTIPLLLFD